MSIPLVADILRWAYRCFVGNGDSHGSITTSCASSRKSSIILAAGNTFNEHPMMIIMSASLIDLTASFQTS